VYAAGVNGRTAAIAGASGLVGGHCLRAALESYERVVALVRREMTIEHPRLEQRIIDFEGLKFAIPCDDAFCALGTTIRAAGSREKFRTVDCAYVRSFADACRAGGARQLAVVSSVGANALSSNFYLQVKGGAEEALGQFGFEALHIFRPSFLTGKRKERRLGEMIAIPLARPVQVVLIGRLRKYRPISAATVGRAMVAAALRGEAGTHIYHYDEMRALSASLLAQQ